MPRLLIIVALLYLAALALGASATTEPTTAPAGDPSATMKAFLDAIGHQDRKVALSVCESATPQIAMVTADHVDFMLAIARLKQAVAARWGLGAPYDLQMAVVSLDECGNVTQTIKGNTAQVNVSSLDPQTAQMQGAQSYAMVHTESGWRLSFADAVDKSATPAQNAQTQAVAEHVLANTDLVVKDVQAGKCKDTNEVISRVEAGFGSE